jgi:hypothetical protein
MLYSHHFISACRNLLDFLPRDAALSLLSVSPRDFLKGLEATQNVYEAIYILEIPSWRISCPHFLNLYQKYDWVSLFLRILNTMGVAENFNLARSIQDRRIKRC